MPNWCANRLRVSGPENEVSKARAYIEGGSDAPGYARTAGEGIQLFLAGCAGLLQVVTATEYAPYPALTGIPGLNTPENRAFTAWVTQLRNMTWDRLSADQQAITVSVTYRPY